MFGFVGTSRNFFLHFRLDEQGEAHRSPCYIVALSPPGGAGAGKAGDLGALRHSKGSVVPLLTWTEFLRFSWLWPYLCLGVRPAQ